MSKDRIDELEKRLEKIERDKEIESEVLRVINNEKKGLFKSILHLVKIIAALILLFTAGDEVIHKYPWISEIVK